jgi:uncharacterized membrane protein YgcG
VGLGVTTVSYAPSSDVLPFLSTLSVFWSFDGEATEQVRGYGHYLQRDGSVYLETREKWAIGTHHTYSLHIHVAGAASDPPPIASMLTVLAAPADDGGAPDASAPVAAEAGSPETGSAEGAATATSGASGDGGGASGTSGNGGANGGSGSTGGGGAGGCSVTAPASTHEGGAGAALLLGLGASLGRRRLRKCAPDALRFSL